MALLFMDSFDHYATADLLEKYSTASGGSIVAAAGRNGSSAYRGTTVSTGYLSRGLASAGSTLIVGFAVKPVGLNRMICQVGDASRVHVQLYAATGGTLQVARTASSAAWAATLGTVVASSAAGVIAAGSYHHLQMRITVGDVATGACEVRINGVAVITATGIDTRDNTLGSGLANILYLGDTHDFDDLWVCDDAGAAPWNDFLGDCRVDARFPTAAGATTGWTPSAGANYACVDEAAPNDDTDYTSTITAGATDTFTVQDAPITGIIYGVQHCLSMKKSDAGPCTVSPVIRHGTTDYPGAALAPGTTYAYGLQIAATNPGTGALWSTAGFNAAEFGYQRVT